MLGSSKKRLNALGLGSLTGATNYHTLCKARKSQVDNIQINMRRGPSVYIKKILEIYLSHRGYTG